MAEKSKNKTVSKTKVTLESLSEKIDTMAENMATKSDLERFASKNDLKAFATKDDLARLGQNLSNEIETLAIMTKNEFDRVHDSLGHKMDRTAVIRR